ncbi:uncharacterized protein LOC130974433 [Arachis stenosperma]|uniref:uncharacterized protein LOC130974433 n=1 Tax=Arachis stenosperma TaxID=217475 RepID=UPI0025AC4592|nr:uncharacterized protein LOC130974433 [Arachis stenosperma]
MASDESFVALVYYRVSIKKKTRSGIKFTDKDLFSIFLKPSTSFAEFKNTILQRLGMHGVKRVEKLFYRILISVLRDDIKYDSFIISSDEDMHVLFHCRCQFPEVRTPELLAKLVDVASSSEGWTVGRGCFCGASSPPFVPVFGEVGTPDEVEDALHDDDDDVEPATIADDSDKETPRTTPPMGGGASSSDLDAMAPQEDPSVAVGFGARDTQNAGDVAE